MPGLAYPFGYSSARVRRAAVDAGYGYACAVGNVVAGSRGEALALPRLTVRASTGESTFGNAVHGQGIPKIYRTDHVLTKGLGRGPADQGHREGSSRPCVSPSAAEPRPANHGAGGERTGGRGVTGGRSQRLEADRLRILQWPFPTPGPGTCLGGRPFAGPA